MQKENRFFTPNSYFVELGVFLELGVENTLLSTTDCPSAFVQITFPSTVSNPGLLRTTCFERLINVLFVPFESA